MQKPDIPNIIVTSTTYLFLKQKNVATDSSVKTNSSKFINTSRPSYYLVKLFLIYKIQLLKSWLTALVICRSSRSQVFLGKGALKICRKFTGEHPCQSAISMKLLCSFTEIALRHEYSHVNLMDVFRAPFPKNTSGRLLLCSSVTIEDQYRSNSKVSTLFFIRLY